MLEKIIFLLFSMHSYKANNLMDYWHMSMRSKHVDIPGEVIENWLAKPLLNIEYVNLNLRSSASIYQDDVTNAYTKWFLSQTLIPITIRTYDLKANSEPSNGYSDKNNVIVTSMESLNATARHFEKRFANYFFIIHGDVDIGALRNIFYLSWKRMQIYNIFLLTYNGVLIYDPFAMHESGNYGKIVKYSGKDTIENTLFNNMRGYPMKVQLFKSVYSKPIVDPATKKVKHVYGVDGRVANLLQKQMNFTMDLQYPDPHYFGMRSPNGTYNGVIGSIIDNKLDLCLTGFFIKKYMVPELEFSVAVYDDKLCIFTPKAKEIPESILPIFAVRFDLWCSFILMAFVCSFLWALLRAINLQFNEVKVQQSFKWEYLKILVDTWVVWVRVNVNRYPPFHSEKIFVASLALVSVIFGSIFESSLSTVYIHPLYYKDIYNLQELDESGLQIVYKYASMKDDLFFSDTSPLFANLHKKLHFEKEINADVIEDVAANGGKAGVTRYTNIMLQSSHLILSKKLWVVPECPKYYTISYVWRKGAPWDKVVNQLLLRILNAGLINKYIAEMQIEVDIKIMRDHLYETEENFKILTVGDLQLAFYVVLTGSLTAFLTLLMERKIFSKTQI